MSDEFQRQRALDTSQSFIVQAPAGSGKTELLIQRYLALLAGVELPEQIVAITFTRKAAAQMRNRVLAALAGANREDRPQQPHRIRTYELARQALARDRQCSWSLIEQPARLKIDTLDALNVWLAHRLPAAAGGIAAARIVENAREHYEHAARRLLQGLGDASPAAGALQRILEYSDSSAERMIARFADLLSTRDQWLDHLMAGDEREFRANTEQALRHAMNEDIGAAADLLSDAILEQLVPLLRHAAAHARNSAEIFLPWRDLETMPAPAHAHIKAWKALPELLLTRKGMWRKQLSAVGFSRQFTDLGGRLEELIAQLAESEDLRLALVGLRSLPEALPGPVWWEAMSALRLSLRYLVAELRLAFAERNTADFVELALAAHRALGSAEQPSDLLLALDRRIQHILVDEFQDTSRSQVRLLELLTAGWERGDGRSLFLVGDPMQSIYRFRNADISLFLRTKHLGIGDLRCETLDLAQNFRSNPALIDWVNGTFSRVFPPADDVQAGAARFCPCVAARAPSVDQKVQVHALRGTDPEAETRLVAQIVAAERSQSASRSVAILVQSRSHLIGLQGHLRSLGLDAHAVQIEAPNQHQITHDLIGLTRALTHFGDRIAWLGVLRAPWCGLNWRDLHALCRDDADSAVWALMNDARRVATLSDDGRDRLERTRDVLQLALHTRSEQSLSRWVQRTWRTLDGPRCVMEPQDIEHAEQFFGILPGAVARGDLDDPARLEELFDDPAASKDRPRECGIEIMSIHRAKGLEFDTVVLLGLGREPPPHGSRALYWHERLHDDGGASALLAPSPADSGELDAVTRWLRGIEQRKDHAERARLLYVAATRAKERLHLVGQLAEGKPTPPARSLLACLWPQVSAAFEAAEPAGATIHSEVDAIEPKLRRLINPVHGVSELPPDPIKTVHRPHFEWAGQTALQVGVVVHRWLQTIAREGVEHWNGERIRAAAGRYQAELRLLGVEIDELAGASERVVRALQAVLDDATGQWLLARHGEAGSELPIMRVRNERVESVRLDRTFVDDAGTRWIIDFKTSSHEGGSTEAFLDTEVQRYREQLERYAGVMSAVDKRPIRVGLYFPLLQAFRHWQPELSVRPPTPE